MASQWSYSLKFDKKHMILFLQLDNQLGDAKIKY